MPFTGPPGLRGGLPAAAGLIVLFSVAANLTVPAQFSAPPYVRLVQTMESDDTGLINPVGLAFSAYAQVFHVVEGRQRAGLDADVVQLNAFALRSSTARIAAAIHDPINVAFDDSRTRLLIYRAADKRLLSVQETPEGRLDPATLASHNASHFPLQNPQGVTVDPGSRALFFLEARGPWLVRVEPAPDGSFAGATISAVSLQGIGATEVRGLAFDPTTEHLHVMSPADQKLYELTEEGDVVAVRDLSEFVFGEPRGMVFAPSGDQTDDPARMSLYLVDGGGVALRVRGGGGIHRRSPQIVELSLTPPLLDGMSNSRSMVAAAASSFTSTVVRTTDMAAFSPPSPDPSGLAYEPASNTLLMVDGEVEETVSNITHFQGANTWHLTLGGAVVSTANISRIAPTSVPMSNEPTGVAWNPNNGHWLFSDDGARKVFDLNPGPDGRIGTADDSWTSFSTLTAGGGDPEGIAYDPATNRIFVADGVNAEVYEYTVAGTLVNHFDVTRYGVVDPESVEFNPDAGTLFVLSKQSNPIIIETTRSGTLLQTINVSASGARAPAGLAYAPASNGSAAKRFYIVARGIDNNSNPQIVDGEMYEMTAPDAAIPNNQAPTVDAGPDQSVTLPSPATLNGSVFDDGLPSSTVTVAWSQLDGPGLARFANANLASTTVTFPAAGSYLLKLTADDGQLTGSDQLTVLVKEAGGGGPDLIFADGFESGNLTAWSSSTTDGGNLSVAATAALVGSTGLRALINDNKPLYVTDESPAAELRYRVRFYFDPNTVQMASGDTHYIFQGLTSNNTVAFRVYFRFSNGKYQLRAGASKDGSGFTNTPWFTLTDAPHLLELDWRAATAAGANDGGLTLWIDNAQTASLTGVDNDTCRIERVRLGPIAGIDGGTQGTYYFDAFESRRQTYIGGAPPN